MNQLTSKFQILFCQKARVLISSLLLPMFLSVVGYAKEIKLDDPLRTERGVRRSIDLGQLYDAAKSPHFSFKVMNGKGTLSVSKNHSAISILDKPTVLVVDDKIYVVYQETSSWIQTENLTEEDQVSHLRNLIDTLKGQGFYYVKSVTRTERVCIVFKAGPSDPQNVPAIAAAIQNSADQLKLDSFATVGQVWGALEKIFSQSGERISSAGLNMNLISPSINFGDLFSSSETPLQPIVDAVMKEAESFTMASITEKEPSSLVELSAEVSEF